MNIFFILLAIIIFAPMGAMELPQAQERVPSLVELAGRKCPASLVAPFDPYKGYQRAARNLNSSAITHVSGKYLARHLAHSNAQTVQTILDESTSTSKFHEDYQNPANNVYEDNHGIYDFSHTFFPPLGSNPETKYKNVRFSADKTICVTGSNLSLTLWDVSSGNAIKQIYYPQNGQNYHDLHAHTFSLDNQIITAWFREDLDNLPDGKPRCAMHMCAFDVNTGQLLYENLNRGSFSVGKKYLYVYGRNGLEVKDFRTNGLLNNIPVENQMRSKVGYRIDPHDDYLCDVSMKEPKIIRVLLIPHAQLLQKLVCKDAVKGLCLNTAGNQLAALTSKAIEIWKPRDGQQIAFIPHSQDYDLHLLQFTDNDKLIYTKAQNSVCGWDIPTQQLLIAKEIPFAGSLKDGVLSVDIMDNEHAALIWVRLGGQTIHPLYTKLGRELSLKELSALLILEYEDQHELPFSPAAIEIIENSEHKILKEIYEKRYTSVLAEVELACAAKAIEKNKQAYI